MAHDTWEYVPYLQGDSLSQDYCPLFAEGTKYYFYDTGQVIGDDGIKLENLTACALLKECHFLEDCFGEQLKIHYLRTKDGRELDFFITKDELPFMMVEVKWGSQKASPNFTSFAKFFPQIKMMQIVKELTREKTYPGGLEIRKAHNWLANLSLAEKVKST